MYEIIMKVWSQCIKHDSKEHNYLMPLKSDQKQAGSVTNHNGKEYEKDIYMHIYI